MLTSNFILVHMLLTVSSCSGSECKISCRMVGRSKNNGAWICGRKPYGPVYAGNCLEISKNTKKIFVISVQFQIRHTGFMHGLLFAGGHLSLSLMQSSTFLAFWWNLAVRIKGLARTMLKERFAMKAITLHKILASVTSLVMAKFLSLYCV